MCAMNSSVTCESATSVTSILCLLIRLSSRSKGPSKLSRCTANAARSLRGLARTRSTSWASSGATARSCHRAISRCTSTLSSPLASRSASAIAIASRTSRPRSTASALVAPQREAGVLDVEQLVGRHVDGHLLVVPDPAAGLALGGSARRGCSAASGSSGRRAVIGAVAAEEVVGGGQAHTSRHRTATSLASWR